MPNEIIRLTVGTTPTPLDLEGAKQVVLQALMTSVQISTDRGFSDYFTIFPNDGTAPMELSIDSSESRLWVQTAGGSAILEVWVVK